MADERRTRKFLDASLVPLEAALLTRAAELESRAQDQTFTPLEGRLASLLAEELRALAHELHVIPGGR